MTTFALRCDGLTKRYGDVLAVNKVSLTVETGEILSVVGPSGSGKTTTLRLIAGFESLDAGEISLWNTTVSGPKTHLPPERRRVGIVFQEHALFPHRTVGENVAFGLHKLSADERAHRLKDSLELVRLSHIEHRYPHELSGGEQQRVALARALAPNPAVLLLDEPFSNIDADLRTQIREEVKSIFADAGVTVVFVTHDQENALFMGDKVAIIYKGHIEQFGTPEQVFHDPETRFAASFLGVADFLPAKYANGTVHSELGAFPLSAKNSGPCELMIRPDDIELAPSANGAARVLSRTFQGISDLYRVRLPSGAILRVQRPHYERIEPGESVSVNVASHYSARCFALDDGILLPNE